MFRYPSPLFTSWGFPEIGGPLNQSIFGGMSPYKPSILGSQLASSELPSFDPAQQTWCWRLPSPGYLPCRCPRQSPSAPLGAWQLEKTGINPGALVRSGKNEFSRNYQELDGKNRRNMLNSFVKQMFSFPFDDVIGSDPSASFPTPTIFDTCRSSKCQRYCQGSTCIPDCGRFETKSVFPILCSVLDS